MADSAQTIALLNRYDADRNGTLDLDEFRTLVSQLRRFKQERGGDGFTSSTGGGRPGNPRVPSVHTVGSADFWEEVTRTFRVHDADANNQIDVNECRAALDALGLAADAAQAAEVVRRYDSEGKGSLGIADFRKLVSELRAFQARPSPAPSQELSAGPSYGAMPPPPPPPAPLYDGWEAAPRMVASAPPHDALRIL